MNKQLNQYSLLLVDDHPMLRKGVAQLISLEENLNVVAEASSGEEGIKMALEHKPDLIMLDLNMRGLNGIDTLNALKRAGCNSKIIMFSVSDNQSDVLQALKSGIDGYLLKDSEPEELIDNINRALQGELVLSAPLNQMIARSLQVPDSQTKAIDKLTQRELEILKYIAEGKSNKLIAQNLSIAESTVKVHVKNLLKKLSLKTRIEAAIWSMEQKSNHQQP